jgi:uncharacterized repeat protein (TIGR02059 family)
MKKLLFIAFAAFILLSGCNKSENASLTGGPGRLSVKITDDPFNINIVEYATVTITKIEIRKAGDNDGDPFIVLSEHPVTIDLFQLRNGITDELVNMEVPLGNYDLVRLYIEEASLKLKENDNIFNLKIPSGMQTGIKVFVNPEIHVEGGLTSELILDFDLSKSFVMRGNIHQSEGVNGFIFKPCVKASNNSTSGRIEGFVKDSSLVKIVNAKVWIQHDTIQSSTFTDTTGHYVFIGVPAGTYEMFATQENYDTASAEGIVVFPANKVRKDFIISSFLPSFVSSVIEDITPTLLEMTYSLTLDNVIPDTAAFTVNVNTVPRTVNSVAISGKKVILTLASAVLMDENVTVAYTKPVSNPLQTPQGYEAASLSDQNVTNNVGSSKK